MQCFISFHFQQASASVVKLAPSSGRDLQDEISDSGASSGGQEDGFAAYSTALSVTVAIGERSCV